MKPDSEYIPLAGYKVVVRDCVPEGCIVLANPGGWLIIYNGKVVPVARDWLHKRMNRLTTSPPAKV